MKIPINEAADQLSLHPAELVLFLADMVAPFEELYPEVDEGLVNTIRSMHPEIFSRTSDRQIQQPGLPPREDIPTSLRLSPDGERVVLALHNKRHWGSNIVSETTLRNHYCRGLSDFDSAIRELARAKLLSSVRGPFSLNTRAKAEIDEIVQKLQRATKIPKNG